MVKNKKIICYDIAGKKHVFPISKLKFRPAVYGILIEKGKILLSKQWDGYDFPGGGIDIDETVEQALVREFREETGLKVKPIKIIDVKSSFFFGSIRKRPYHSILIYFLVKRVSGKLSLGNIAETEKQYIDMPEWVNSKDLKRTKFYNSVKSLDIIKKAIKER